MLKGAEVLALLLGAEGGQAERGQGARRSAPAAVYLAPGTPLGRVRRLLLSASSGDDPVLPRRPGGPRDVASDAAALGLCLGGALLPGRPAFSLLGPAGLLGALAPLASLGQWNDFRSAAVLLDGGEPEDDPRGALAEAAPLPLLEAAAAEELQPLLSLSVALSEAAGLPVALRVAPRALGERVEGRYGALRGEGARPGEALLAEEAPCLTVGAAQAYHRAQRAARLQRLLPALSPLLLRTPGAERRGVILAGHLGRRAQARASGRGLPTLRLGFALPLPEAALREFCAGLKEVLVLEEGAPCLLRQVQEVAHRAGLPLRVRGAAALSERSLLRLDGAALEAELERFAGPGRGDGPAPAYDGARLGRTITESPRPHLDERGELDVEPWALHLSRLRRELPVAEEGEARTRLLRLLQRAPGPLLVTTAPGAAFAPDGAPLCALQPPRGLVAATGAGLGDGALGGLLADSAAPRAVVVLGDEAEAQEELAAILDSGRAGLDVLYLILCPQRAGAGDGPLLPLLQAAGLLALRGDLDDEEALGRRLAFLLRERGPRALLCGCPVGADSQSSA